MNVQFAWLGRPLLHGDLFVAEARNRDFSVQAPPDHAPVSLADTQTEVFGRWPDELWRLSSRLWRRRRVAVCYKKVGERWKEIRRDSTVRHDPFDVSSFLMKAAWTDDQVLAIVDDDGLKLGGMGWPRSPSAGS